MNEFNKNMAKYCLQCINNRQHYSVDKVHDGVLAKCLSLFAYDKGHYTRGGIYEPLGVINRPSDINVIMEKYFYRHKDNDGKRETKVLFPRDAIHVRNSAAIRNLVIVDRFPNSPLGHLFNASIREINRIIMSSKPPLFRAYVYKQYHKPVPDLSHLAHRDAIQIIPRKMNEHIDRYCSAPIGSVDIRKVEIRSTGSLQGIFCSDGIIEKIHMDDVKISTVSSHYVTLSGVLSGNCNSVVGSDGKRIKVKLLPLRLGGGRCNINVLGFSDNTKESYKPIRGNAVSDHRHTPIRGLNVSNFDLEYFRKTYPLFKKITKGDRFDAIRETVDFMIMERRAILVNERG